LIEKALSNAHSKPLEGEIFYITLYRQTVMPLFPLSIHGMILIEILILRL
jgi:hypothetical protein